MRDVTQCCTLVISTAGPHQPLLFAVFTAIAQQIATYTSCVILALIAFYLSLISTSLPLAEHQRLEVDRAISVLESRGFDREAFMLRHTVTYRSTDNWLNMLTNDAKAYASTNFPFQIITLYPDFSYKSADDIERAMILLHESRHLLGENEHDAYTYAWKNRYRIGWSYHNYSATDLYLVVEQQTRENATEIFNCPDRPWEDCTEPATEKIFTLR